MYRTEIEIEQLITEAYGRIARRRGDWVCLVRIRDEVGDVCRHDVDAVLRRMDRRPEVELIPEANQKTLNEARRDAAVILGNRPQHLIAIW